MELQRERTAELCEGLKLERIAGEWSELAREGLRRVSYADFVEKLLNVEVAARPELLSAIRCCRRQRCRR
jgi:hypothetical protein